MLRLILPFVGALFWQAMVLAADAAPQEPPAQTQVSADAAPREVVRALFTSAVVDREPVDSILALGNGESHVYCFTELRGFAGQRVTHRWEHDGQVMAEVNFEIGGWRWRVWSRKNLRPEWHGHWRVSVLDQAGRVVLQRELAYEPAHAFAPTETTVTAVWP